MSLDEKEYREFPLVEKVELTHNTRKFRFALPSPDSELGLPIGMHVWVLAKDADGKEHRRSYTPTSLYDAKGHFDLVIKLYPTGIFSQYIEKFAIGDKLKVCGPKGRFKYSPGMKRAFGMLAGGSGITPCFQIMKEILRHPEDKTQLSLLYGNLTVDDILLRDELDEMDSKDNCEVYHVLNNAPEDWKQGSGFITPEMISTHFPAPAEDVLICLCGPPPMIKAMKGHLDALGYTKDMLFTF
jgi:cytochrome-b5 reductase